MQKKDYNLGLDLGVGSVGWSCVLIDDIGDPYRILDLGSRIFNPEGASMEDRRNARGSRRVTRRRRGRGNKTRELFVEYKYLTYQQIKDLYHDNPNPYKLRLKGKEEKLTYEELCIVLVHYTKGRGFKSNRKVKENEDKAKATNIAASDEQKLLGQISNTEEKLKHKGNNYTITNLLSDNYAVKGRLRNTSGKYLYGTTRAMIEEEVNIILEKQVQKGLITEDFKQRYLDDILLFQRTFSQGPDAPSEYHDWLNKAVGTCTFEKGRPRAARASFSYKIFITVQKLQNLRFKTDDKWSGKLTTEQIKSLIKMVMNGKKITYKVIAKEIGKPVQFKGLKIDRGKYRDLIIKLKEKDPELLTLKEKIIDEQLKTEIYDYKKFNQYEKIRNKLNKSFGKDYQLEQKQYDLIADCLTRCKSDEDIDSFLRGEREVLKEVQVSEEIIEFTKAMNDDGFKTFGRLSYECLYKIIPLMIEEGKEYSEAVAEVYGHHSMKETVDIETESLDEINNILERLDKTITNRSVVRTLVESRKVINAIIRKYGKPSAIHIELARELAKSHDERDKIERFQTGNRINREALRHQIYNKHGDKFYGIQSVTSEDIIQYRLFIEQDGICPYTLLITGDENKAKINEKDLFTSEVEIDHIIPYSMCGDDRVINKTLVKKATNQDKRNQTPLMAFPKSKGIEKYSMWVKHNSKIPLEKETRYMTKELTESLLNDFRPRTINDTRYATTALKEILSYSFPSIKVRSFTGQITAKYRNVYRLNNLTHSYIAEDYKLRTQEDEKLENLYKELEIMNENNISVKDKEYKNKLKEIATIVKEQEKVRDNHLHHAVDATLIAVATNKIRYKIQKHEIALRMKRYKDSEIKFNMVDDVTGEVYSIQPKSMEEYMEQKGIRELLSRNLFPEPYEGFKNELIYRVYERNNQKLKRQLSGLEHYQNVDLSEIEPLFVSHYYSAKVSGKLHKETNYGIRKVENIPLLTQRIEINNDKFKKEDLEKLVDKETTQKYVYQAIHEWLKDYDNGKAAYAERTFFPKNKNGNEIRRVKIYNGEVMEAIKIKADEDKYAMKDDVLQVHIYQREGDDKLYFVGMDLFRILNRDKRKDLNIILWSGQGKQNIVMPFSQLGENGFKEPPLILNKGQIIYIEKKTGEKALAKVTGFNTGLFEVKSILGDGEDLIFSGFNRTKEGRFRITVSTIKSIKPISVDVLGKIHSKI